MGRHWDAELDETMHTNTVFVQSGPTTIADYTSGHRSSSPTYTYVYASYIDEPRHEGGTGGLRTTIATTVQCGWMTNGSGALWNATAYSATGWG